MGVHTLEDLQQFQALPLNLKIRLTQTRIRTWVNEFGSDGVYVSFSGGKDSTVLLDIVRKMYPEIEAVFCDTGLEYPEIREFVKTFDNVTWLKPKMSFFQVCEKYGFPLISKEVSECVYGARKYLKSVVGENNENNLKLPYQQFFEKVCGLGRYAKSETEYAKEYADIESLNNRTKGGADRKYRKLRGTGEFQKENTNLKETLLDNVRVQRLLGIYSTNGKTFADKPPSESDRSAFSCERYQFFLDAPFEISQKCCSIMKKDPFKKYHKETGKVPITAQMAAESRLRTQVWLKYGCNAFDAKKQVSNPMSFWTEQDVLLYIVENNLPICSVYGDIIKTNEVKGQLDLADLGLFELERPHLETTGCSRTGCILCGYGCHLEKPGEGRFERLKETHPKFYNLLNVAKNNGITYAEAIKWVNENGDLHIRI